MLRYLTFIFVQVFFKETFLIVCAQVHIWICIPYAWDDWAGGWILVRFVKEPGSFSIGMYQNYPHLFQVQVT